MRTTTRVHPASAPAEASASDLTDTVIAIMSGNNRKGRWRVRPRTRVIAFWGAAHLDLRDAAIDSPVVEIEACAVMGGVTIIVPEGIPVEMTGCVIMGGRKCRIADVPPLSGAPVIRVRAGGLWGGVEVRSRPSRRSGGVGAAVAAVSAATAMATAVIEGASTGAETLSPNGAEAGASAAPSWDRGVERLPGADRRRDDRDQGRTRDRDADRNGNRRDRSGRRESRPGASPPATPTQSGDLLTVVCTDIVGSTRLSVSLGDQRWHAVLSAHNALVRELIARHGGTEIKTVGDGFLLTFTSARAALQFSMALQDAVSVERSSSSRAAPSTPTSPSPALADAALELRIGVHAGEVERDGRDVIGRNVIIACRLCDVAEPGEVLASAVVADLADSASDLAFGPVREHNLVGIDQPLLAKPAIRA